MRCPFLYSFLIVKFVYIYYNNCIYRFAHIFCILFFWQISARAVPVYLQGNYAVPQTPQTIVGVPFKSAQIAGNTNIVVVGWNNATARVTNVSDRSGNVYHLGTPASTFAGLSQSIYYATNIRAAASNTVTVLFQPSAPYPDIRIAEYSGIDPINPIDISAASSGNSTSTSSGAAQTTNAFDLLLAANTVATHNTGPGAGFTQRMITSPDGDILEDRYVTTPGMYAGVAPLWAPGPWIMQMLALRVTGNSTPTPSPTATPTPLVGTPTLIQHIATGMDRYPVNTMTCPLANPALAGNCLILGVQCNSAGSIASVQDDKGNTWLVGPTTSGSGHTMSTFYVLNAIAGTEEIIVTFSGLDKLKGYPQAVEAEFNNIALSDALDGVSASPNSRTAGTLTTTVSGDLVWEWGAALSSTNTNGGAYNGMNISAGSGFTLLSADLQVGSADQYQIQATPANINPSFDASGSATWGSVAMALKPALAGNLPGPGIHIVHLQHTLLQSVRGQNRPNPIVVQFPSSGNLLVGLWNAAGPLITNITDSLGNTWSLPSSATTLGGGQFCDAQIVYAANAKTASTLSNISVSMSAAGIGDAMFNLYDVAGAADAPFDKGAVALGNQTVNAPLNAGSITPSTANGIVFNVCAIDFHTLNGMTSPIGGIFDTNVNGLDNADPLAASLGGTDVSTLDMDNGYAHIMNPDTNPISFIYTATNTGNIGTQGVLLWGSAMAAFK